MPNDIYAFYGTEVTMVSQKIILYLGVENIDHSLTRANFPQLMAYVRENYRPAVKGKEGNDKMKRDRRRISRLSKVKKCHGRRYSTLKDKLFCVILYYRTYHNTKIFRVLVQRTQRKCMQVTEELSKEL